VIGGWIIAWYHCCCKKTSFYSVIPSYHLHSIIYPHWSCGFMVVIVDFLCWHLVLGGEGCSVEINKCFWVAADGSLFGFGLAD